MSMRDSLSWSHELIGAPIDPAIVGDMKGQILMHQWEEYLEGGAHCPKCGTVRLPTGETKRGWMAPCEPLVPSPTARVVDGVIIDGPPS